MSTIVHFEIPADDPDRAQKFYSELFDWEIKPFEGNPGYRIIQTSGEKPLVHQIISSYTVL